MKLKKNKKDVENALMYLMNKYNIQSSAPIQLYGPAQQGILSLQPGYEFFDTWLEKNEIPLLIWRMKRKFTELRKIVLDGVIEEVCLFRISSMGSRDKWSLATLLYREMDLLEFIGNGKIVSIQAIFNNDRAGNVILKLDNDILCSIEVSVQLPVNSILQDRHEIIGRRGVASDLVVDTQVAQSSVYSFTEKGEIRYTDVDMELYGFDDLQIDHIRAAFQVLKSPDLITEWRKQHNHLVSLVKAIFKSDKECKKINFKNESTYTYETN